MTQHCHGRKPWMHNGRLGFAIIELYISLAYQEKNPWKLFPILLLL